MVAALFNNSPDPVNADQGQGHRRRVRGRRRRVREGGPRRRGHRGQGVLTRRWTRPSPARGRCGHRAGDGLQLHQRLPRRRQRDRDLGLDPGADARGSRSPWRPIANLFGAFFGAQGGRRPSAPASSSSPTGVDGLWLVAAALVGAIGWNLLTWWFGLPSSSSHALIGGLAGAALVAGVAVQWDVIWDKVVIPMVALAGLRARRRLPLHDRHPLGLPPRQPGPGHARLPPGADRVRCRHGVRPRPAGRRQDRRRRRCSPSTSPATTTAPPSRSGSCVLSALVISAGTYAGGWRIMRTLGRRIIDLTPPQGFAAETTAASILYVAGLALRCPDLDDAHDHLGDHGRRRDQAALGRALGRRRQHRRRVVPHLPRRRPRRRRSPGTSPPIFR